MLVQYRSHESLRVQQIWKHYLRAGHRERLRGVLSRSNRDDPGVAEQGGPDVLGRISYEDRAFSRKVVSGLLPDAEPGDINQLRPIGAIGTISPEIKVKRLIHSERR